MIHRVLILSATCLSLFVINNAQAQLSFTNQSVNYGLPSFKSEHSISMADLNGDHRDDLFVLDSGLYAHMFFQDLSGGLIQFSYPNQPSNEKVWGLCVGDVNNDGLSEIFYGGQFDSIQAITKDLTGNYIDYKIPELVFMQGMSMVDLNGDNNLDLLPCHDFGANPILVGDGFGNFAQDNSFFDTNLPNGTDNSGNYGLAITDIENDGDLDVFIAKCKQGVVNPLDARRINVLFKNDGTNNYFEDAISSNLNSGDQSWSADFGDVDNDGDMDMFIAQHSTHSQILSNNGQGVFTDITTAVGIQGSMTSIYVIQGVFEDFDNDGWLDLLVSGGGQFLFCMNNGDGTFDYSVQPNIFTDINSYALGDLNSDGFIDIYTTSDGYGGWSPVGRDSLYINDGNSNHFLTFTFEGTISNKQGIGARVELYGPWGVQLREVRSGASYGIQNSLNAHFGLGQASYADSAIVRWPSGQVDRHVYIVADQFVDLIEGIGTVGVSENKAMNKFVIYPNPVQDILTINLQNINALEVLTVLDVNGRVIKQLSTTDKIVKINLSNFPTGNYQVVRQNQHGTNTQRFVKTE